MEVVDDVEQEARAYTRRVADADETILADADEAGGTRGFSGETLQAELRRELEEGRGVLAGDGGGMNEAVPIPPMISC